MFHKELDRAEAGDNMGALLRGVKREQIKRGQVIIIPGSVKAVKFFTAQIYVLTKDEGGRYTPFTSGYKPQMFLRTADMAVELKIADAERMVMPGDNVEVDCVLLNTLAVEVGTRFTLREGHKTSACIWPFTLLSADVVH